MRVGWILARKTWVWNEVLGTVKYIFGFPLWRQQEILSTSIRAGGCLFLVRADENSISIAG